MNNNRDVLIIDDEENIRYICEKALNKADITADAAASAEEALEIVKKKKYKVALLDIVLPKMDGLKFFSVLKGEIPDIEIIMLTGNATIEDSVNAMKMGAYDFITKPFGIIEIRKTVENAMEKEKLSREVNELKQIISISDVTQAIGRLMPINKLLKIVFDKAKNAVNADGGSIALFDPKNKELIISYIDGMHDIKVLGERLKLGERICGYVAEMMEPVIINGDLSDDPRFKNIDNLKKVKSGISVPMIVKDELVGVFNLRRVKNISEYTEYDLRIMTIFAQRAALAIKNAIDYEKLKKLNDLKTEFVANISHELRTLLTIIREAVSQISSGILGKTTEKQRKVLFICLEDINRLEMLINDSPGVCLEKDR